MRRMDYFIVGITLVWVLAIIVWAAFSFIFWEISPVGWGELRALIFCSILVGIVAAYLGKA